MKITEHVLDSEYIDGARIQRLNRREIREGSFVLYWMQHSQRSRYNHALEYAVEWANRLNLSVLVLFVLAPEYPDAGKRHYRFMLSGLKDVRDDLASRGLKLIVRIGDPVSVVPSSASNAALLVTDRGYLRHLRVWRKRISEAVDCPCIQVESDTVVPVETASDKREYAARTIRKKIMSQIDGFGRLPVHIEPVKQSLPLHEVGIDLSGSEGLVDSLEVPEAGGRSDTFFRGGQQEAEERFESFLQDRLFRYTEDRNEPVLDATSHMSPYLHFGQVSPIWLYQRVESSLRSDNGRNRDTGPGQFAEELVVRRELAVNYVFYEPDYDVYGALPEWARITLKDHQLDRREYVYSLEELESAETHDEYWNAAMKEMVLTGFMHNYMRMYWGKKILEWTPAPEEGYRRTLYLNNKYFLDGRDPSSYANIGWIYGLHDRPWTERSVYGKVRTMTASGLERKFDIQGYVTKIDGILKEL